MLPSVDDKGHGRKGNQGRTASREDTGKGIRRSGYTQTLISAAEPDISTKSRKAADNGALGHSVFAFRGRHFEERG